MNEELIKELINELKVHNKLLKYILLEKIYSRDVLATPKEVIDDIDKLSKTIL